MRVPLYAYASGLTRTMYASLPWGYRLAELLIRVSSTLSDTFGRLVYAEFLRVGIEGMPDIHGKPASELIGHTDRNLAGKLPSGYGEGFGIKAQKVLYSMGFSPDAVEDVLQKFMLDFVAHPPQLRPGAKLHEAERYVLTKLVWEAKNARKKLMLERSRRGLPPFEGESIRDDQNDESLEDVVRDIGDPHAFNALERTMSHDALEAIFKYLAKHIHEDIPLYLQLSAQGYDDREIIGDTKTGQPGMLPHLKTTPSNFQMNYKRHIQPAVAAFLRSEDYKKLNWYAQRGQVHPRDRA